MESIGINPTTFKIVLGKDFYKQGDILNRKVYIHDNGQHCIDVVEYSVQTLEDLHVEILHFKFLYKYNLL